MQKDETQSSAPVESRPAIPCRHLRCKEMSYQDPGEEDEFASGIYWCVRTQENMGPDGRSCSKCECGPERPCYQA